MSTPLPPRPPRRRLLASGLNSFLSLSPSHPPEPIPFTHVPLPFELASLAATTLSQTVLLDTTGHPHLLGLPLSPSSTASPLPAPTPLALPSSLAVDPTQITRYLGSDHILGVLTSSGELWVLSPEGGHPTRLEGKWQDAAIDERGEVLLLSFNGKPYHLPFLSSPNPPTPLPTPYPLQTLHAGAAHFLLSPSLPTSPAHAPLSFGDNRYLQLGLSSSSPSSSTSGPSPASEPAPVPALQALKVTRLSAAGHRSAAVSEGGDCFVWGAGEGVERIELPFVDGEEEEEEVVEVSCGAEHVLLLTASGKVFGSGSHQFNQLSLPPSERVQGMDLSAGEWAELNLGLGMGERVVGIWAGRWASWVVVEEVGEE